jgi:hypothetical protein
VPGLEHGADTGETERELLCGETAARSEVTVEGDVLRDVGVPALCS